MDVRAGVAYGIIVDGFDGKFGTYELAITAAKVTFSCKSENHWVIHWKEIVLFMCHTCRIGEYHASFKTSRVIVSLSLTWPAL